MKQHRALVVAHDVEMVEEVAEVLTSLGHEYDVAASQQEACGLLHKTAYDYVVLDPVIPVRAKSRRACLENGWNLLEKLCDSAAGPKVIVLVGPVAEGGFSPSDLISLVQAALLKGAARVVYKPFPPNERTLDKAIKRALAGHSGLKRAVAAEKPAVPTKFAGGEMAFYPDRVELCGVKILGDTGTGQARAILEALAQPTAAGGHVRLSGETLAKHIQADGGVGTVTGCIRTIRRNIALRLLRFLNVTCKRDDVIANDGVHGYRLRKRIIVRHATAGVTGSAGDAAQLAQQDVREPVSGPVGGRLDEPVTERQQQILDILAGTAGMRVPAISARTKVSPGTVKRELVLLKGRGVVAFEGSPRHGRYKVTAAKQH